MKLPKQTCRGKDQGWRRPRGQRKGTTQLAGPSAGRPEPCDRLAPWWTRSWSATVPSPPFAVPGLHFCHSPLPDLSPTPWPPLLASFLPTMHTDHPGALLLPGCHCARVACELLALSGHQLSHQATRCHGLISRDKTSELCCLTGAQRLGRQRKKPSKQPKTNSRRDSRRTEARKQRRLGLHIPQPISVFPAAQQAGCAHGQGGHGRPCSPGCTPGGEPEWKSTCSRPVPYCEQLQGHRGHRDPR